MIFSRSPFEVIGLRAHGFLNLFDETGISRRWPVAIRIDRIAFSPLSEVDRIEPKAGRERAPFIIVEQRPMQVPHQRNAFSDNARYFLYVQLEVLAACHAITSRSPTVFASSQGHAIFRNEDGTIEVFCVVPAKKVQP